MRSAKQQFNIYLEPDLVTRLKHRAIDEQLSLSDLAAEVFSAYLKGEQDTMNTNALALTLQPMVHVEDMAASVRFYEALGATVLSGSRDGDWTQLALGGAEIGLLAHPANPEQNEGTVELNFASSEPLDELQARLEAVGVKIARGAADEAFGAQLQIESPDGLLIKINRTDPSLYS